MLPGSFDPAHTGHFSLVRGALEHEGVDHVVIAVIQNPTKTRLLTPENSQRVLECMMPDDLKGKVTVVQSCRGVPSLITQYGASIVIRGAKETGHRVFSLAHEFAVAAYFSCHRLAHFGAPPRMAWVRTDYNLSATDVRAVLFSAEKNPDLLATHMPLPVAETLCTAAKSARLFNKDCPQSVAVFNTTLAERLKPASPAAAVAVAARATVGVG